MKRTAIFIFAMAIIAVGVMSTGCKNAGGETKLLASVTNSVKDMGGFDDDQPLWIGEQLYYDVSSGDPKVIFIPGVKFDSGFVLVYDDMPELSAPFIVDENGSFTIQEITVTAKQ